MTRQVSPGMLALVALQTGPAPFQGRQHAATINDKPPAVAT